MDYAIMLKLIIYKFIKGDLSSSGIWMCHVSLTFSCQKLKLLLMSFPTWSIKALTVGESKKGIFLTKTAKSNNTSQETREIHRDWLRLGEYWVWGGGREGVNLRVFLSGLLASLSLWLSLFHALSCSFFPSLCLAHKGSDCQ